MRESLKYASKSRGAGRDALVADHSARIALVEQFVQVRLLHCKYSQPTCTKFVNADSSKSIGHKVLFGSSK